MAPLATLFPWIATAGLLGLLAVTLLERLVPLLPSTALLVALGVAVAEGHCSLAVALWSSMAGSLLGSLSFYGIGVALGETRSFAGLKRSALFLGVSEAQLGRWITFFRRHETMLAFASQLIPSVRFIAPAIAGLLRVNFTPFLVATSLGVTLWTSLFLGLGYTVAQINGATNASTMATKIVLFLLVSEGVAIGTWRAIALRHKHPLPPKLALKN